MKSWIKRNAWQCGFMVTVLFVLICHLVTVGYSPLPWIDEVHILDMGQGGLFHKEWMTAIADINEAKDGSFFVWAPYYLGGLFQECAYQIFNRIGPRVVPIMALAITSFLCAIYTFRKCNSIACGICAGLLLLLDPLITASAHGGRVDIYAFTALFAALLVLSYVAQFEKKVVWLGIVTGVGSSLVVTAVFIWPSVLILCGLVAFEVLEQINKFDDKCKAILICLFCGIFSAVITASIILCPLLWNGYDVVGVMQCQANEQTFDGFHFSKMMDGMFCIMRYILKTPLVVLFGFIMSIFAVKRFWIALITLIFWLVYVGGSRVYEYRFVYFIPYCIVGIALGVNIVRKQWNKIWRYCAYGILTMGLVFGLIRSVLVRNVLEYLSRGQRSYVMLERTLKEVIGEDVFIYTSTFQSYYAGRNLRWKMFRTVYDRDNELKSKVLRRCQYVICEKSKLTDDNLRFYKANGFVKNMEITIPEENVFRWTRDINIKLKRNYSYGPYVVLSR